MHPSETACETVHIKRPLDLNTVPRLWAPFYMKRPKVSKINGPIQVSVIIFGSNPFKLNGPRLFKGPQNDAKVHCKRRGACFLLLYTPFCPNGSRLGPFGQNGLKF